MNIHEITIRYRSAAAVIALVASSTAPASAGEKTEESEAARMNVVGAKVGHLSVFEPEEGEPAETKSFILLGLMYERSLIHETLEVELSLPVAISLDGEGEITVPIDLHLKFPLLASGSWSPYLAVGPTVDIVLDHSADPFWGVSAALGTYFWFSDHIGLDLEVDYNAVFGDGKTVHELLFAAGPVLRF